MGISDTFSDALESAGDLSFETIYNLIFHTDTFPGPFTIMSIYVCFYLRLTTFKTGMKWYRSFLLGLCLVYLPRYTLGKIISRSIKESQNYNFLVYYSVVWLLFNIFPFDLIFKFCNRPVSRLVLAIMEAISESLILVTNHFNISSVFSYEDNHDSAKIIMYMIFINIIPLLIQKIDAILSGEKKRDFCFPIAHFKRTLLSIVIITFITKESFFWTEAIIDHYSLIPLLAFLNGLLRAIDYIAYEGYIFHYVDFLFPSLGDHSPQVFA